MIFTGCIVNFLSVLLGGFLGGLLKKGIPDKIVKSLISAMALCVLYIGFDGLFLGQNKINLLIVILSMGIGIVVGELVDIDKKINSFGNFLQKKLTKNEGDKLGEAFVSTTLLFCVGAMAINGSLNSSMGDHTILYAKSVIDGITCFALSATLGFGCILSAFSVLIYQGLLTGVFYLAFSNVSQAFETTVNHIGAVGSLLIVAIGLNMLNLTKIKTANYVFAMAIPIALCPLFNLLGIL